MQIKKSPALRRLFFLKSLATVFGFVATGLLPSVHASQTWDGGGTTGNWSDAVNWSDDVVPVSTSGLTFGTTAKAMTNDLFAAGTTLGGGLTFSVAGFTLSGNSLILGGGIANTGSNTVALDLGLGSATRNVTGTGTLTISGVVSDGGATARSITAGTTGASGFLVLTGNNTFSGGFQLLRGTVTVNTIGDQGSSGAVGTGTVTLQANANNATFVYNGAGETNNRQFLINGATNSLFLNNTGTGTLTLNGTITSSVTRTLQLTPTSNITLGGVISDGSATLAITKLGTGTLTISGANTYKGTTTVTTGLLSVTATGTLGTGNVALANTAGVVLTLANSAAIGDSAILTFGANSVINLNAAAGTTEVLGTITNSVTGQTVPTNGVYTAAQLNTLFGVTSFTSANGETFTVTAAVPEPGTFALGLLAGGAGLVLLRRRSANRSTVSQD